MGLDDDERLIDDETTVISDGRHAVPDPADDGLDHSMAANADDAAAADSDEPRVDLDPADGNQVVDGTTDPAPEPSEGDGAPHTGRRAIDPPPPPPDGARQRVALPPGPALVAVGLGLLTKNGWVFQDINLTLRPASVAAIVGPAGSGRTSLLLALVGRMEANTGTLTVAGHSLRDRPKSIRLVSSVARAGRLTAPEPGLTVSESVAERCLIEDEKVLAGRSRFEEACAALKLVVDPTTLVGRIAGEQATLLAVALACVRVSAVIILDDLDRDVSAATQQRMVDAFSRLAKAMGPTIIVSTTDRVAVMDADVVLDLTPMDGAAIWALDPRDDRTDVITQGGGYRSSPWAAELPAGDADPGADPDCARGADPSSDPDDSRADPGADPDDPSAGVDDHDGTDPDHDGRWSRERWETGAEPDAGDPDGPDQDAGTGRSGSTQEADGPGPNSTDSSDLGGTGANDTAASGNAPTEDPR